MPGKKNRRDFLDKNHINNAFPVQEKKKEEDFVFECDIAGADTADPLIHFSRALRKGLPVG